MPRGGERGRGARRCHRRSSGPGPSTPHPAARPGDRAGRRERARASAARRHSTFPRAGSVAEPRRGKISSTKPTIAFEIHGASRACSRRLSATVSPGIDSAPLRDVADTGLRESPSVDLRVMSFPSIEELPGSRLAAAPRRRATDVVFPAPFGPSSATTAPSGTAEVDTVEHGAGVVAGDDPLQLKQGSRPPPAPRRLNRGTRLGRSRTSESRRSCLRR